MNPEVYRQFEKATGLQIMEGYGQTELTLAIANLIGEDHKIGSMGKPSPLYDIDIVDADGNPVPDGETGEIVGFEQRAEFPAVFLRDITIIPRRRRRSGTTDTTTPGTRRGEMRTAFYGLSEE